jgi:uncharacterized protein
MIQTDISQIKNRAEKNSKRNWDFRDRLRACDLSLEEIDQIVHELTKNISSQIDCRACANCCLKMSPLVNDREAARIARHLKVSTKTFKLKYLEFEPERKKNVMYQTPCPFLKDNICSKYDVRPGDCRSFPHLHKPEFMFRLRSVISNCAVCPIVFNVYEGLKEELANSI